MNLPPEKGFLIFMTSILYDYFPDLFKNFLLILRKSIAQTNDPFISSFVLSSNILLHLGEFSPITAENIINAFNEPLERINQAIAYLKTRNLIRMELDDIFITETGKSMLQNINKRIFLKLHEYSHPERVHIKGMLLSDNVGRTFLVLETIPKFWETMLSHQKHEPEPSMITMFLTAIRDFGFAVDTSGFSQISLTGANNNIFAFVWKNMFSIFFIDIPSLPTKIINLMRSFIKEFYSKYEKDILLFLKTGALTNLNSLESVIGEKLNELNQEIEKNMEKPVKISKEQMIQLYQHLDSSEYSVNEIKEIKNLLFNYALLEDPVVLDEIYHFFEKFNLFSLLH